MRTLLGHDNLHLWETLQVWNDALANINIVISTPQVLLDGLGNGFLQLRDISLLIFDEAHHCRDDSPTALTMRNFYHPLKSQSSTDVPHVLGLTASSQMNRKIDSTHKLETLLDAVCRTPTRSIEEYAQHTYLPRVVPIDITSNNQPRSKLLEALGSIFAATKLSDDPYYLKLKNATNLNLESSQKLAKFEKKQTTPAISELKALLGNAEHLHDSLGSWASDRFIKSCVSNWHRKILNQNEYHDSIGYLTERFIDNTLARLRDLPFEVTATHKANIAPKASTLIQYLSSQYRQGIAVIIFVERRSAAFALCELLRSCPELKQYRVFSFVGLATGTKTSLIEVADIGVQKKAFADFRSGSQDICIATSVAEEGVDIQAVNIVIRYDDPKQFVAFVQSRGRARKQESQFVYFRAIDGKPNKYAQWECLEAELQEKYRNEMRDLQTHLNAEDQKENGDEVYVVPSTGARLDYSNSKTHLEHFCATLSKPANPLYILNGEVGIGIGAKAVLPSSLPSQLQHVYGKKACWLTQRLAERDAAFEAYKALHIAGLVDDHLMPIRPEKSKVPQERHGLKQLHVEGEAQVWNEIDINNLYAHRVEVTYSKDEQYPVLIMVLPRSLPHVLEFALSESTSRSLHVTISPMGQWYGDVLHAKEKTKILFKMAFHTGSAFESLDDINSIPLLLLPESGQIEGWQEHTLFDFLSYHTFLINQQPLLIWLKKRARPYVWRPPHNLYASTIIPATPIRKLQIYTGLRNSTENASQSFTNLRLEECITRGIGTVFGPVVLLIPSILHMVGAALRANMARQTVLSSTNLRSGQNLTTALLAKSSAGVLNYERLEFLGDAMLKYYTTLQLFGDHGEATEGVLTAKALDIVSNIRLETAIQNIELARYITTEAPVQAHWKVPKTGNDEPRPLRKLLSKTVADCAESILGAAFLDGKEVDEADANCISVLRLLLPEVVWRTPADWVRKLAFPEINQQDTILRTSIKKMLGYSFRNASLLREALTHSSLMPGQQSLDRLEFLGDAIIDRIVKTKLFAYGNLDASRMTKSRHALASHHWLAYCALGAQYTLPVNNIDTSRKRQTLTVQTNKIVHLTSLVCFSDSTPREQVSKSQVRYTKFRNQIEAELGTSFPWTSLRKNNAPKVCSDIIESLVAAIYLDCGSLDECERVLNHVGVMRLIERMAVDKEYEVETPEYRLHVLCAEKRIIFKITSDENIDSHTAKVTLDGMQFVQVEAGCRDEAESKAAEKALEGLLAWQEHHLTDSDYTCTSQNTVMAGIDRPSSDKGADEGDDMVLDEQ